MNTTQALARALHNAGYTAAELGRAINPNLPRNAVYKAGMRLLDGTHATDLDRLGELARGLGATFTIGPAGVEIRTLKR